LHGDDTVTVAEADEGLEDLRVAELVAYRSRLRFGLPPR